MGRRLHRKAAPQYDASDSYSAARFTSGQRGAFSACAEFLPLRNGAAVVRASARYKRDHFWLTLMVKARRRPRNAPRLSLGAKRNAGAIAYGAIWVTLSPRDLQRVCTGPTQL